MIVLLFVTFLRKRRVQIITKIKRRCQEKPTVFGLTIRGCVSIEIPGPFDRLRTDKAGIAN